MINRKSARILIVAGAIAAMAAMPALSQFTYTGCDNLKTGDFKKSVVLSRNPGGLATDPTMEEPVQMDLHGVKGTNGKLSHVDIYFVQRLGSLKRFDGSTGKVTEMGKVPVWGKVDNGLMGIVLDPAYDANRWIYLWYIPPIANTTLNRKLRLSRFTATADKKLDMASEKILIEILGSKTDNYHSGGPMHFDAHGDLWIQIGNNSDDINEAGSQFSKDSLSSDEWGASNTASMRGGTIRIHPDNSAKGYSIPKGNFGEYWAAQFDKLGKTTLAAEYRDTRKVLPEIYVKGERSNYSISVHPTKRWLAWGTVNYQSSYEEFNITATPVFSGFPYFHANNERTPGFNSVYGFDQNAALPVNTSPLHSGVKDLPPAMAGTINGLAKVAIGGPIYVFDPSLDSRTKFPPHLHNTWINTDFTGLENHPLWVHTLDTVTLKVTRTTAEHMGAGIFAGINMRRPVQAKYGPEGALYILNYDGRYNTVNPAFYRMDYVGACQIPVAAKPRAPKAPELEISISLTHLTIHQAGRHELGIYDLSGNRKAILSGGQGAQYSLKDLKARFALGKGIHIARVKTPQGVAIRNLSML